MSIENNHEDKTKVTEIPIDDLSPFKDHPFRVTDDEEMETLKESIMDSGVLVPAIARPKGNGKYELISGHRRLAACRALGIGSMPVIVHEMTDTEAVIAMVDSNFQREHKIADMSEDQIDDFVEYINSLRLIDTGLKNRKKGWQYYLYISQNQGDAIHITFLEGSIVDVDGHICVPLKASLLKEIYEFLNS